MSFFNYLRFFNQLVDSKLIQLKLFTKQSNWIFKRKKNFYNRKVAAIDTSAHHEQLLEQVLKNNKPNSVAERQKRVLIRILKKNEERSEKVKHRPDSSAKHPNRIVKKINTTTLEKGPPSSLTSKIFKKTRYTAIRHYGKCLLVYLLVISIGPGYYFLREQVFLVAELHYPGYLYENDYTELSVYVEKFLLLIFIFEAFLWLRLKYLIIPKYHHPYVRIKQKPVVTGSKRVEKSLMPFLLTQLFVLSGTTLLLTIILYLDTYVNSQARVYILVFEIIDFIQFLETVPVHLTFPILYDIAYEEFLESIVMYEKFCVEQEAFLFNIKSFLFWTSLPWIYYHRNSLSIALKKDVLITVLTPITVILYLTLSPYKVLPTTFEVAVDNKWLPALFGGFTELCYWYSEAICYYLNETPPLSKFIDPLEQEVRFYLTPQLVQKLELSVIFVLWDCIPCPDLWMPLFFELVESLDRYLSWSSCLFLIELRSAQKTPPNEILFKLFEQFVNFGSMLDFLSNSEASTFTLFPLLVTFFHSNLLPVFRNIYTYRSLSDPLRKVVSKDWLFITNWRIERNKTCILLGKKSSQGYQSSHLYNHFTNPLLDREQLVYDYFYGNRDLALEFLIFLSWTRRLNIFKVWLDRDRVSQKIVVKVSARNENMLKYLFLTDTDLRRLDKNLVFQKMFINLLMPKK